MDESSLRRTVFYLLFFFLSAKNLSCDTQVSRSLFWRSKHRKSKRVSTYFCENKFIASNRKDVLSAHTLGRGVAGHKTFMLSFLIMKIEGMVVQPK